MNAADPVPAPVPRRRRWLRLLLILLVCVVALALLVRLLLPPERALRLVLAQLEPTLGLQIEFEGDVDYRLRGTPELVVRNVVVRVPGETTPMLRAERVLVSLPWKTIRSRGADLEITRVELDAPRLHLPTLLRWFNARPPGDGKVPPFTDGLGIVRGTVDGDGWQVDGLSLDVPSLHAELPLEARISGRVVSGTLRAPFRLHVTSDRVVGAADLTAVGTLALETGDARLQTTLQATASRVDTTAGIRLSPLHIAMDARWRDGETDLPFALGLHGALTVDGSRIEFAPAGVATRAEGLVPTLAAGGVITFDRTLAVALDGTLSRWPPAWPALPPPLDANDVPMPFAIRYSGALALDAPVQLRLDHAGARFDGSARIADITAWFAAGDGGAPVPPLRGTLHADRIDIGGAQLDGVEIEFDDGNNEPLPTATP